MKRILLFLSMLLLVGGTTMAFANGANGSSLTRVSNNENSASTCDVVQPQNNNSSVKPLEATNDEPVITFTTSKKIGERIELKKYDGDPLSSLIEVKGAIAISYTSDERTGYTLTAQTVKIIGNCTSLNCSGNGITSIDFSKNSSLFYLDCALNQLTSLDLSGHSNLNKLDCSSNKLTQIQLKYDAKLNTIKCESNSIDLEHMEQLINSLPKRTAYRYRYGSYSLYVQSSSIDGNQITAEQERKARDKGWNVFAYRYTTPTGISTIDNADASPRKMYDLNGCEVNENQAKGVVIVKQGNKTYKKVVIVNKSVAI